MYPRSRIFPEQDDAHSGETELAVDGKRGRVNSKDSFSSSQALTSLMAGAMEEDVVRNGEIKMSSAEDPNAEDPLEDESRGKQLWRILRFAIHNSKELKREMQISRSLFGHDVDDKWSTEALRELVANHKHRRRWYIFSPQSTFIRYWDLAQVAFLVYVAVMVPLKTGFEYEPKGVLFIIDFMTDIYFSFDIVICFLTAYENKEHEVIDEPLSIALRYIRGWFLIDLCSVLPVNYVVLGINDDLWCRVEDSCENSANNGLNVGSYLKLLKMLRISRLIKMARLIKFSHLLERYQDEMLHLWRLLRLIKLVTIMSLVGHMCACVFYFASTSTFLRTTQDEELMEMGHISPWVLNLFGEDYESVGIVTRYISALYWSFCTMSTVGYGDIVANTVAERMVAIWMQVIGTFLFSYTIAKIAADVDAAHGEANLLKAKLDKVCAYLIDLNPPKSLRKQILNHFRDQQFEIYDERQLLFELPFRLRTEILQHKYRDVIREVPMFSEGGSSFQTELFSRLNEVFFSQHTDVYDEDEIAHEMYIISHGRVEMWDAHTQKVVASLGKGAYFGEGAVIEPEITRTETARCQTGVGLLAIKAIDVRELMTSYPHLFEDFRDVYLTRKLRLIKMQEQSASISTLRRRTMKRPKLFMSEEIEPTSFTFSDRPLDGRASPKGRPNALSEKHVSSPLRSRSLSAKESEFQLQRDAHRKKLLSAIPHDQYMAEGIEGRLKTYVDGRLAQMQKEIDENITKTAEQQTQVLCDFIRGLQGADLIPPINVKGRKSEDLPKPRTER